MALILFKKKKKIQWYFLLQSLLFYPQIFGQSVSEKKPWELTNTALQNGHGSAVIDMAVYSIRWGHKLAGLASPVDHPIVTSAAEGARRRLARPVQPKEPISEHMLLEITERYNTPSASLLALRFLFILLIGCFGLFRINEILRIRPCDIQISGSHLSIFISSRMNDQHRNGHTSILARSGKITCPVSITEKIMSLLPSTHKSQMAPIVRRVVSVRNRSGFMNMQVFVILPL